MRTLSVWLVVCVAVGLVAGCKNGDVVPTTLPVETPKPPVVTPTPPVVTPTPPVVIPTPPVVIPTVEEATLEVEAFKLDEAEVKDLAGASGGKAVLFGSETSGAETAVPLKKGTYQVTLYMQGGDSDHDAVYLSVAGVEYRLFPDEAGKVMAVESFTVQVTKDGPVKVILLAAETDVYLDKVVLKRVK